jgi:hypothetical protein
MFAALTAPIRLVIMLTALSAAAVGVSILLDGFVHAH